MATLTFKTNITSPLGIQALWDSLRSIGVNSFKINFTDFDNALTVVSDYLIPPKHIISIIRRLGYDCEELF